MPLSPLEAQFAAGFDGHGEAPLDWAEATKYNPALFFSSVIRVPTWTDTFGRPRTLRKWQEETNEKIRAKFAAGKRRIRLHIRTCWGAGKDWYIAGLALAFTSTRRDSRGLTMAQNKTGVRNLLWPNIASHYSTSILPGLGVGKLSQTRLTFRTEGVQGEPVWYIVGGWAEDPAALEGHHSNSGAIRIIDEAAGVDDGFFDKTEGMLDAPEILDVWISTPALRAGRFYERDIDNELDDVIRVHVSKDDLIADGIPGQLGAAADLDRDLKRRDHQLWNARRNGEYMEQETGSLYPVAWIDRAMKKTWVIDTNRRVAWDVAGSVKGDENAVYSAAGPDEKKLYEVRFHRSWQEKDTAISKGHVLAILRETKAKNLRVDVTGIGKGPKDQLTHEKQVLEAGVTVEDYRSADPPLDKTRFANRKAEDAWYLRDLLHDDRIRLPDSQELRKQMALIKDEITGKGKHQIVDPADSPDHFDAVMMCVASQRAPLDENRFLDDDSVDEISDIPYARLAHDGREREDDEAGYDDDEDTGHTPLG